MSLLPKCNMCGYDITTDKEKAIGTDGLFYHDHGTYDDCYSRYKRVATSRHEQEKNITLYCTICGSEITDKAFSVTITGYGLMHKHCSIYLAKKMHAKKCGYCNEEIDIIDGLANVNYTVDSNTYFHMKENLDNSCYYLYQKEQEDYNKVSCPLDCCEMKIEDEFDQWEDHLFTCHSTKDIIKSLIGYIQDR